jgi:hypothetical protein
VGVGVVGAGVGGSDSTFAVARLKKDEDPAHPPYPLPGEHQLIPMSYEGPFCPLMNE